MIMARLLVPLLITALLHCCHVDSFFMTYEANITPTDALVFINQTLEVQCQLILTNNMSPYNMSFMIEPRPNDTLTIPKNATVIGNKNITTELNITSWYSNYTTVYCMGRDKKPLRTAGIYVEYPIQNITSLNGTLFYDNSTIVFTWSLGQTYLDPSSVNVTVDWNPNSAPNMSGNECAISNKEFCLIPWNSQQTIFIRINVSHTKGANYLGPENETSATSVHQFQPYDNLKAGPPDALRVENVTSTCVEIGWEDSLYFKSSSAFINTTYRIERKAGGEQEFIVVVDKAERLNSSDIVSVCQLIPFTKYSLSVQLRAYVMNPWSDRAVVVFETEEDRPLTGPPMTNTSYQVGECVDNKRDVFVYWTDPSKHSLRGQLVRFEVESNNNSKKFLRAAYNYYTDSIDCDSASNIRVYSATKVGPSENPSEMHIPEEIDELTFKKDLMFRVEEESEDSSGRSTINVTVRWDPGDHVGQITLIVYMCAETYVPHTCFDDFKTTAVKQLSDKKLQLIDIPSTTNLFGYAVEDNRGRKSGIHWTNCVYQTNTKPDKPVGLHVTPGSQANSLEISWTSAQCNRAKKVLIIRYFLLICKQPTDKCVDSPCCLNITFSDFSINNYTAKGLAGGRPYYVYIQAQSPAGVGPVSDVKVGTPRISTAEDSNVDRIVIAVTVVAVVLVFIFVCVARHCLMSKKSAKDLKDNAKTVTLPGDTSNVSRQDSGDSGAWTGSDPSSNMPIPASRPIDTPPLQLSTHAECSTVRIEISPVDVGTGAGSQTTASPQVVNDSESNAPYMQIGNPSLVHDLSHPTVVDHGQLRTSSASNTESRVARGSYVKPASGSAGAKKDASSSLDADTSSSNPYMQFMNTSLSHDTTQPASSLDVSDESSSDSIPILQLDQTSHLPLGNDIPLVIFITHQCHEQTAPEGEDNNQPADYVICTTDGNIHYQTEHCRPDTNSVVPHDILSIECQALAESRNQGQSSVCSGVEESEERSNRFDSVVPMEVLLSSEYQRYQSRQGQNAAGPSVQEDCLNNNRTGWIVPQQNVQLSDVQGVPAHSNQAQNASSSNLQENHRKVDHHDAENDAGYIRQVDANIRDSGGDDDKHGVRPTQKCLGDNTAFDDNTSLLSSRSDLSLNSSNYSLALNDFNIDSLISNSFMNDGRSNFNMQGEDNVHNTMNEHIEVLDGFNQEFRNDPGDQDSLNVRVAPEVSSSDHQGAVFQASPTDFLDNEAWDYEHSGETSRDAQLDDSRQQRSSCVDSSGYQPLPCLDTYSSCEGSDLSQNSPTC